MPRWLAGANNVGLLTSGTVRLTYLNPRTPLLSGNVRLLGGAQAAAATPTLVRAGLYSIAANGDGTLVASTANDTSLFSVASTRYTKAWSSPIQLMAGAQYAVAQLCVTAATAPNLVGCFFANDAGTSRPETLLSPVMAAQLTGQTDLPASFSFGSLLPTGSLIYSVLLP